MYKKVFKVSFITEKMFGKKCNNCGKKTKKGYTYCPHCGNKNKSQDDLDREFGLLGTEEVKLPFGFNMIFNTLMKEMEKQLQKSDSGIGNGKMPFKEGINITVNMGGNGPFVGMNNSGESKIRKINVTEEMARKLAMLPRQEAEASVRRFSNKVVYEIGLPGVRNINNVIISKLESSVEVKAIADDKIFFKLIPLNMQLLGYCLKDEKLMMEFKG